MIAFNKEQKINPTIFRNYDIRGIYPDELNEEVIFQIILAFAKLYPHSKEIVVSRDSRNSGLSLSKAVVRALISQGIEVIDIGLSPDPLFFFTMLYYNFSGGVMITASHSPKEYNGLDLNTKQGSVTGKDLQKIQELASLNKGHIEHNEKRGRIRTLSPKKDYLNYVLKKIKIKKPLKIVIDCGNGAMSYLPEQAFTKIGCSVKTIFAEPNGDFPNHLPDPCLDENLDSLKREVIEQKADIGFAFDGDGDRVVLIDNKGRRVLEDYCLLMLAKHVFKQKRGPIVHGVRISNVFLEEMKKIGAKTYFSVCHHNAVIQKIEETGAVFGGEITSHYYFPKDYYLVDDALFSALKLAEIVSEYDNFSEYVDSLPKIYVSPEIFIKTPDQEKAGIIKRLKGYLEGKNIDFIGVDGVRIQFENGWALARMSNTSPYIKLRFEGRTEADLKDVRKKATKLFQESGMRLK